MICYKCNATLSESDFCNKCGADVKLYKKIIRSSEAYYNQGLAMAEARDLQGAADCLRRSVKLNKHNTKARNLLGLVYFETGEAVAAMSQWVISKSLQPEKNIADKYLDAIQKNSARLETINQTIKKYNQALTYAKQGSLDLAVIQLKKVLNLNPNLVKGHQLLALLYIQNKEFEKAVKPLKKAAAIDKNNALTLKYLKEVKSVIEVSDKKDSARQKAEKLTMSGDDVIMPTTSYRESNAGGITILNIIIGIALGAALMWFLVLPSKEKALAEEGNRKQQEISDQLELKSAAIASLETEKAALEAQKAAMETELNSYKGNDGILAAYANMMAAMEAYMEGDFVASADALLLVDRNVIQNEHFLNVYQGLMEKSGAEAARTLYNEGYAAYQNRDYEKARELLEKANQLNPQDTAVLYYLGRSLQRLGDSPAGRVYLQEIIDKYPNDAYAQSAQEYMDN